MMFKLKVESVTLEIELARDKWVGCKQTQKCEKILMLKATQVRIIMKKVCLKTKFIKGKIGFSMK